MTTDIGKIAGGAQVKIDIVEIRKPELDAQCVCEQVVIQLERRIAFRRAMKRAVQTAMEFGANGIRIRCGGRLGGADIARAEWYREGKVPLQTLRVPIDYGFAEAKTTYGIIGVKCWINKDDDADKGGRPAGHDRPRRRGPGGDNRGPGGRGGNRGGDSRGGDSRGGGRPDNNQNSPAAKPDAPAS